MECQKSKKRGSLWMGWRVECRIGKRVEEGCDVGPVVCEWGEDGGRVRGRLRMRNCMRVNGL